MEAEGIILLNFSGDNCRPWVVGAGLGLVLYLVPRFLLVPILFPANYELDAAAAIVAVIYWC